MKRQEGQKRDSLVNEELFEITLQKIRPIEPTQFNKRRAFIRNHTFTSKNEPNAFFPNMNNLFQKLEESDKMPNKYLSSADNLEFRKELAASNARLKCVQNGSPAFRIMSKETPIYPNVDTRSRINQIQDILGDSLTFPTPKERNISLVEPPSHLPERVDLFNRISYAESQNLKLRRLYRDEDIKKLEKRNQMINDLNHANERRIRASEAFFSDYRKYGLKVAQDNYKRAAQKSRLRIMNKVSWWEDFISYAYEIGNVTPLEEKLILFISKNQDISRRKYLELYQKFQKDTIKYSKCLRLLDWLNNTCNIIDEETLSHILHQEPSSPYISPKNSSLISPRNSAIIIPKSSRPVCIGLLPQVF